MDFSKIDRVTEAICALTANTPHPDTTQYEPYIGVLDTNFVCLTNSFSTKPLSNLIIQISLSNIGDF